MKINRLEKITESQEPVRAGYAPPALREFGPVGLLTQGGSGIDSELMMNGNCSMNPNASNAMC
jgi:hypothetical protein